MLAIYSCVGAGPFVGLYCGLRANRKGKDENKENILFILFFPWAFMVLMATWSVVQLEGKIKRLENQPKTIIYKVDNAGV